MTRIVAADHCWMIKSRVVERVSTQDDWPGVFRTRNKRGNLFSFFCSNHAANACFGTQGIPATQGVHCPLELLDESVQARAVDDDASVGRTSLPRKTEGALRNRECR